MLSPQTFKQTLRSKNRSRLNPMKIYKSNIYLIYLFGRWGGGVRLGVCVWGSKNAERIHWPWSCTDWSESSQSLLCKELKPPLQIAPIFVQRLRVGVPQRLGF